MRERLKKGFDAFTLVEVLVTIAVISILLALITTGGTAARRKSKIYQVKTMIASLQTALALYHVDFGAYPPSGNQNMVNLLVDVATYSSNDDWHGPYMSFKDTDLNGNIPNATLVDSWDRDYYYILDTNPPYKIWSAGPNNTDESGGGDDIKSW